MRGPALLTAAGLKLGHLRSSGPPDVERGPDKRLTDPFATRFRVDDDFVETGLDPERGRVDDHGGCAHDVVAIPRHEQGDGGIGDEALESGHVRYGQGWVELRKETRQGGLDLVGDLAYDLNVQGRILCACLR